MLTEPEIKLILLLATWTIYIVISISAIILASELGKFIGKHCNS